MPTVNTPLSLQLTTPLGPDKLVATGLSGSEGISELFLFTVTASATADGLDAGAVTGKAVTLTLVDGAGLTRSINGIATRVAVCGKSWSIDLRPWTWLLGLASDNRIFQQKSAPDIVKAVFADAGFTDFQDKLTGSYAARDYCVQYQETNLAFVLRLFEDEGIWFSFSHEDGKHTLVMGDDCSAHAACANVSAVKFLELTSSRNWLENNRVEALSLEHNVVTGKYQSEDFNFETPTAELKANAAGSGPAYQIYDYPGWYQTKDAGDARAGKRLQIFEAMTKILSGRADVRHFTAGGKITISGHPDSALNGDWVLAEVRHDAAPGAYANSFTAFPADVVFRPARRTRKPRIAGSHTAIVTGKAGEEIWTDSYGRIKVQFPWDQLGKHDENTTCWIRVAQSWAGKSWGAWVLPRIGQEVVVTFLDGDPDRPLVTGCVYNGDNSLPYPLPDNQTRSTLKSNSSKGGAGYNEIRFEDKADAEEIFVHARKDLNIEVEKGNRTVTVMEGNDSLTISKGNRTTTITEGNETHEVQKGTRAITVKDAETHTNQADFTHEVKGNYTLKVSGDFLLQVSGKITVKSDGDALVQSGAAGTVKTGTSLTLQSGTDLTAKAGTGATLQGGTTVEVKGSASGTVDGGGMLTVKGGMVKIN
ncbi:type VI secretion system Vgr family protein [Phaeospirillum tilakii]|uniref:Type VI secretion system Vgr family protein n=1 Tax=Phaeospirillum tilakii TaxID=741673 RepID=A0ABW5CAV7_9PROT